MIKMEIYAHESLEKPVLELLAPVPPGTHDPEGKSGRSYSLMRNIGGRGSSGTSMGDDVWPETNIKLEFFIDEMGQEEIVTSISRIRTLYPKLGLAVFISKGFTEL